MTHRHRLDRHRRRSPRPGPSDSSWSRRRRARCAPPGPRRGRGSGGVSSASEEAGAPQATEVVVVNEGDTLWGIAAGVAEEGEVRAMVSEIRELNNLDSSVVTLGQEIHVPVAD
ncbi:LysM peptidoglycan-binding domain-containing protein [Nocardioides daphniae]|uniref:LysM peptidoglycan-binding domain-containing protein n=1 Tax=Nocardioides daphniae TaxID=402297 RepID=A0A4P7UF82_9ACTN|nr:LysM peptidoglycan-binding domain-containing protein [Nocardioides daphniae]QCC78085.1 LysM peptidoglycan-binding domain-containing protein [Nocardioides daphniae]